MSNKFHYTKKDQVFNKDLINQVLGRFDQIHKENAYKSITSNIKELTKNDVLNEPLMHSLLNKIYEQFKFITGKSDLIFLKVWLVSTKSNHTNKEILPYIPHIDRNRKLKAMVYLHDIDLEHGPIHLGKLKHTIDIDRERKKLPEDFQAKGLNTIDDDHLESDLVPMTGKAGDIIFFDTNTPHKAGIVKDNYCRKILRFDFERPYFNPKPTILDRLISKLR